MSKPVIAQKGPFIIDVEAGTYYWCACGRSKTQPFCDGSHQGTDFTPVEIKAEEARTLFLCGCKHTRHPPFCDGEHGSL